MSWRLKQVTLSTVDGAKASHNSPSSTELRPGEGQRARLSPGQNGGAAQEGQAQGLQEGRVPAGAELCAGWAGPRRQRLQAPFDPLLTGGGAWPRGEPVAALFSRPSVPAPGPGPPCPAESPQGQLILGGGEAGKPGARVPGGDLLVRGGPRGLRGRRADGEGP